MNNKIASDKERLDLLTNMTVDDILEMSDSELSSFACDIVGDERNAAHEFDASIERIVSKYNRNILAAVENRLKAVVSVKAHEPAHSAKNHKRRVTDMIQRNQDIVDRAAQPISESRKGSTASPKKKST